MTHKARQVLADCRLALSMLEEEQDLQRWRIHWAAAVALVRAVGHVLDKVDGRDPDVRAEANALFKEWKGDPPEHLIFRDFIEKGRNSLLKEYEANLHPLADVPVLVRLQLAPVASGGPTALNEVFDIPEYIYRPLLEGTYEGNDARDVLEEALKWWRRELDRIDGRVARVRKSRGLPSRARTSGPGREKRRT